MVRFSGTVNSNSSSTVFGAVFCFPAAVDMDCLSAEIAKELGVYNTVETEGWGSVSARNCGNIVKKAIEMAERNFGGK